MATTNSGTISAKQLRFGLAASLLALAAAPVLADVKAGVDAWAAGDYPRAVSEWQGPAAQGDADALFNLAQAYRLGRGVEASNERARALYEEAARRGHVKAADNYGLMLFEQGEQEKAMPLIRAAAERGDPRAQYVLSLSHFNADYAPRDWVQAYALMTLANGQGLPQAREAIAQMDSYIPQVQRQQAQSLARRIESQANVQRTAGLASTEHGTDAPAAVTPVSAPARLAGGRPVRGSTPVAAQAPVPAAKAEQAAPAPRTGGNWRVQLGAFGVAANAERMWSQLATNPALAGTRKTLIPSGNVTRLLATGYASEADAGRACARLEQQGQSCMVAGQG
jgi:TPR repeat protein